METPTQKEKNGVRLNKQTAGSPCSDGRFHFAQTNNGVPVCPACIKAHKHQCNNEGVISIGQEECYVCEAGVDNCYLLLAEFSKD